MRSSPSISEESRHSAEGQLSKSKQALKRCINEMNSVRDKISVPVSKIPNKIAAPKPVRARPQALSHLGHSKWIETSPVKTEREEVCEVDGKPNQLKQFPARMKEQRAAATLN